MARCAKGTSSSSLDASPAAPTLVPALAPVVTGALGRATSVGRSLACEGATGGAPIDVARARAARGMSSSSLELSKRAIASERTPEDRRARLNVDRDFILKMYNSESARAHRPHASTRSMETSRARAVRGGARRHVAR